MATNYYACRSIATGPVEVVHRLHIGLLSQGGMVGRFMFHGYRGDPERTFDGYKIATIEDMIRAVSGEGTYIEDGYGERSYFKGLMTKSYRSTIDNIRKNYPERLESYWESDGYCFSEGPEEEW